MSASPEALQAQARARVAAVADSPDGRLALREAFYERFGFPARDRLCPRAGFGASELDFLRWEIRRGVLNPLSAPAPGSAWWREVNANLLLHAELAALLSDAGYSRADDAATQQWLSYIQEPSAHTWYRAHNASIVSGYLDHREAAVQESPAERTFMNMVLYRLLYAQALVEGEAPGIMEHWVKSKLGWVVRALERIIADPRSPSVDIIVHLPDFYPDTYPLHPLSLRQVIERGHLPGVLVEEVFDRGIIAPELHDLYSIASHWLSQPDLIRLVNLNRPIYPNLAMPLRPVDSTTQLRKTGDSQSA
jgi:hypothetical protein